MTVPVYVTTCDRYVNRALRPFAYLFERYWSPAQPVVVIGFQPPPYELPGNFRFYSAGTDTGQKSWSTALIRALQALKHELFILLLDDYWLNRPIHVGGVASLAEYVRLHPDVLRLDLTTDRLYNGKMFGVEDWGRYSIVETPAGSEYQMSLQAGIWRRSLMLQVLEPEKSPWEVELQTSPPAEMRVVGTRGEPGTNHAPVVYANVFQGGSPDTLLNLGELAAADVAELDARGWL